jgi:hypothetical protein
MKPLEAEIDRLNTKIDENRAKLANDVPYAWNVFAFLSKRLSDQEKSEIRLASINAENAIRIKQIPLDKARRRLGQLNDELARRKILEVARLAAEIAEKARKERLAREKAEEARHREWARQQAERSKAAQEAAERFRQEQAKQARETAERNKRESAAREARWKAAQEAADKARQEQTKQAKENAERIRKERVAREAKRKVSQEADNAKQRQKTKQAADARKSTQHAPGTTDRGRAQRSNHSKRHSGACRHKFWWNKVEGHHVCAHCTRPLFKFAEQCPGCDTIACATCRYTLKAGGTPSSNNDYGDGHRSSPRSRRNDRDATSGGYTDDYYDWD